MSINLVCDDCGKTVVNATYGLPDGWTGDSLGSVRPVDTHLSHRCDECHDAIREAQREALAQRHEIYRERWAKQEAR